MSTEIAEIEQGGEQVTSLTGMYKEYFIDYASYVILERAVPEINDGFKPVQRRILHALFEMNDGRYHKVANVIGQTMQYHPHGDAAIGDALVNLGQKELLIDAQGNWGDYRTGDRAAAPRYIEARLSKFALAVLFNKQTTEWQLSYDGRKQEPIQLPVKFPLLLAQGAEGIAVGLSTKILSHNFQELIKASINLLQGKRIKLLPDFLNGGLMDATDYNQGRRGGKVKVRARIEILDNKSLIIKELPYNVTTTTLIDSIIKANDKGKIKIKRVLDNTAENVEIIIELAPGTSPQVTMDALYAFTNCEVSISPNACVIIDKKPHFIGVHDILQVCTDNTRNLLQQELQIKFDELLEKWHFASLERIFIQERIYRDIEECESWDEVIAAVRKGLDQHVATPETIKPRGEKRYLLNRNITDEDITKLTEIRIKRISKYNVFKADEQIQSLEEEMEQVQYDLDNIVDFTIAFYQNLLDKFGKGRERRTEITSFETIKVKRVVANNAKLYVNRKDGFIGSGLKKDEFVCDCSDIDDVIVFRKDGRMMVTRLADKTFVGKDILHVAIWRKGDERTTYHFLYTDGATGTTYAKRFNVKSITRDREYVLGTDHKRTKVLYFSANPNGESEVIQLKLTPASKARKKIFDYDFGDLDIKGRGSKGNTLTKYPILKVSQLEVGKSTLGKQQYWMDEVSGRLNTERRGKELGGFDTGDFILAIYTDGTYEMVEALVDKKFDVSELLHIEQYNPDTIINAVYYDGTKSATYAKRFHVETSTPGKRFSFISDDAKSKLLFAAAGERVEVNYKMRVKGKTMEGELAIHDFIDVKGWKSLGNKVSGYKLIKVELKEPSTLKPGDTIELF